MLKNNLKSGGKIYERMAREVLKHSGLTIKSFDASLFLGKNPLKNVAIIHHIDYAHSPLILRFIYPLLGKIIFHNLRRFGAIVTVSKYWEQYFKDKGFKNVHLIYNAFNLEEFNFSSNEIEEFKKRHNLTKKPIIYIGNRQRAKGVTEAYKSLKDLDVHLVTSGDLSNRDYLRLLKASSIAITMSKFKEGWCRTTHEAMLCKTSVIGSGKGGMCELLSEGGQIICEDFKELKKWTIYLLNNPEIRKKMGEDGYNFAKDFTPERFKKSWLRLIKKLTI